MSAEEAHSPEPGFTGMTCEAMCLDEDGSGTTCGRPLNDPVHQPNGLSVRH